MDMWWWDKVGINLVGARETVAAATNADQGRMEELRRGQKMKTLGTGHRYIIQRSKFNQLWT